MAGRPFKEGESCVLCGTTEGTTLGRGACSSCYQKERRRLLKSQPVESAKVSEPDFEVIPDSDFKEDLETEETRPGQMSDPSAEQVAFSPDSKEETLNDKFKNFLGIGSKPRSSEKPNFSTNEKKPGSLKNEKRVSAAGIIADSFNGLGGLISRSPRHRPSGILLQWQSDAAGEVIDEAVKGTFIDTLFLQKAARGKGRLDQIGSILIPPAIVFAIEMNPERYPQLAPILESSIRNSLPTMAKGIKKAKEKKEKQNLAIAEIFPDLEPGQDPVKLLMSEMFDDWYSAPTNDNPEGE